MAGISEREPSCRKSSSSNWPWRRIRPITGRAYPSRGCRLLTTVTVAGKSLRGGYCVAVSFDTISHEWLIRFLEHRIGDQRVIRHVKKWLKAGVLEEGKLSWEEHGTPQGGSISPLLANLYLHHAFDLWIQAWRKRAAGDVIVVRYADDFVVGFQHRAEAERFLRELRERLARFNLELHPTKTRLIEFGRFAAENVQRRGGGKPETFDFLGFTHACGRTQKGEFQVIRRTIKKRLRAKLKAVKTELREQLHHPVPAVGKWLATVLNGYYRYHSVPGNGRAMWDFRYHVGRL
jgi:group II intron reverse transcriptase/maturase